MSRAAVIVIGSNSTRCVCADLDFALTDTERGRVETRLFLRMRGGRISDESIKEAAEGVRQLAASVNAPLLGVYATSAVRDAENAAQLAAEVQRVSGREMRVLSGEEEAAASFAGAAGAQKAGMIDIGSGSTEVATGEWMRIGCSFSLQLGASRLFMTHPIHDASCVAGAVSAAAAILAELPRELRLHKGTDVFYSVGGTGTAAETMLRAASPSALPTGDFLLTRRALEELLLRVAAVPRYQRSCIPGFPASRADILPTGMAILLSAMDTLHLSDIRVTRRGNGDGLLRLYVHKKCT